MILVDLFRLFGLRKMFLLTFGKYGHFGYMASFWNPTRTLYMEPNCNGMDLFRKLTKIFALSFSNKIWGHTFYENDICIPIAF